MNFILDHSQAFTLCAMIFAGWVLMWVLIRFIVDIDRCRVPDEDVIEPEWGHHVGWTTELFEAGKREFSQPSNLPPCQLECVRHRVIDPVDWVDCGDVSKTWPYACNRIKGHTGPHVACGGGEHAIEVWTDQLPATGKP